MALNDNWLDDTLNSLCFDSVMNFNLPINPPVETSNPAPKNLWASVTPNLPKLPVNNQIANKSLNSTEFNFTAIQQLQQTHTNYRQHKQDFNAFNNSNIIIEPTLHQTPSNYHNMVTPSYVTNTQQLQNVDLYQNQNSSQISSQCVLTQQNTVNNTLNPQVLPNNLLDDFIFSSSHAPSSAPPGPTKTIMKRKIPVNKQKKMVRTIRPKVSKENGAVQCAGINIKKGTQCRNAALMEFMGPKPIYCAEHINLDPNSIYCKCVSTYGKEKGDKKKCREVVLKEFSYCHKHFEDRLANFDQVNRLDLLKQDFNRVSEILSTLEKEAAIAKTQKHDLFQRKNKLIPKFVTMKKILQKYIDEEELKSTVAVKAFSNDSNNPSVKPSVNPSAIMKNESDISSINLFNDFNFDEEWKTLFC